MQVVLSGSRHEFSIDDAGYPQMLRNIDNPPEKLYVLGNPDVLTTPSIAIIGPRRATAYGLHCTEHFAELAVKHDVTIVSGGAIGCDTVAHRVAVRNNKPTIVVLAGGCDHIYPVQNAELFQAVIDNGGAIVSERFWGYVPTSHAFLARNRITTGIPSATLVCECGLPSGTLSACDKALTNNRGVFAVPGNITSPQSLGCNKLIQAGAIPIFDDASFLNAMCKFDIHLSF